MAMQRFYRSIEAMARLFSMVSARELAAEHGLDSNESTGALQTRRQWLQVNSAKPALVARAGRGRADRTG
jgi:hypothetical protein